MGKGFATVEQEEFRLPSQDDRLFTDEGQPEDIARVFQVNYWVFLLGYKRAGDILVEGLERGYKSPDLLIFPVLFLYRHYIELALKHVVYLGDQLKVTTPKIRKVHDLAALWRECRKVLEQIDQGDLSQQFDATETLLVEFTSLDPWSFVTRYPEQARIFPEGSVPNKVNLKHVSVIVGRISNLLDGAAQVIEKFLEDSAHN
ncbi:MAG: hypothetical protein HY508_15465 [Acidobacteria bacterium]|nr:hypothetical protein [Acidobacteriota bacterium]